MLAALQQAEAGIAIELVASNELANPLRREADTLRMVRPAQESLDRQEAGRHPHRGLAHTTHQASRHATPAGRPMTTEVLAFLGYDKDSLILRAAAQMGLPLAREHFALRTDDQVTYGRLIAAGAGIGFAADYNLRHWRGVVPVLPGLQIPPLPCWLAVHREIRSRRVVRRVFEFLAEGIPRELAMA